LRSLLKTFVSYPAINLHAHAKIFTSMMINASHAVCQPKNTHANFAKVIFLERVNAMHVPISQILVNAYNAQDIILQKVNVLRAS